MKRRSAIKKIGLATSGGILLSNIISACADDETPTGLINYDGTVVIIGAGASGLYAADLLNQRGINVRILEAGKEIGGRARSLRSFDDFPVELGADIVYGNNSIWSTIINDLNLNLIDTENNLVDKFVFENQVFTANELSDSVGFVAAQEFINNISLYQGDSQSISQAITEGDITLFSRIIEGQVGNRYGSDITRLDYRGTAEALSLSTSGNGQFVLTGSPVQDILFSRFNSVLDKVEFETVVQQVSYGGDQITIRTSQGDFTADKVIVTVPVPILKSSIITFTPALPFAKTAALSRIGMDSAIKIFMKFNRNFWGEDTHYIYGGDLVPTYVSVGAGRSERNRVLSAEIYGTDTEMFNGMSNALIASEIVKELDQLFNGGATQNNALTEFIVMNWGAEEYIQGGYSYQMAGGTNIDRMTLAESVDNKLYFAGEATNINGDFGTLQGALQSAEKATSEIIENIMTS